MNANERHYYIDWLFPLIFHNGWDTVYQLMTDYYKP